MKKMKFSSLLIALGAYQWSCSVAASAPALVQSGNDEPPISQLLSYECLDSPCCQQAGDQCYRYFPYPQVEDIRRCLKALKQINPFCGVRVVTRETLIPDDIVRVERTNSGNFGFNDYFGVVVLDGRRLMGAGDAILYSPLNITNVYLQLDCHTDIIQPLLEICYRRGIPTLDCQRVPTMRHELWSEWHDQVPYTGDKPRYYERVGYGTLSVSVRNWSPEYPFMTILIMSPFDFASVETIKFQVMAGQKWLANMEIEA